MFRKADKIFDGWARWEIALFWLVFALVVTGLLWLVGYPGFDPLHGQR